MRREQLFDPRRIGVAAAIFFAVLAYFDGRFVLVPTVFLFPLLWAEF